MESELGDDAVYGPFADTEVTLAEFLSDHLGTGLRIQKAVTDDLTDQFLGASVVGFGAAFGTEESLPAFVEKEGPELEVTLTAKTEFSSGTVNALRAAFALDEHGKLTRDLIVLGNGQGAEFALDPFVEELERNHEASWAECQKVYLNMAQHPKKRQGKTDNCRKMFKLFREHEEEA